MRALHFLWREHLVVIIPYDIPHHTEGPNPPTIRGRGSNWNIHLDNGNPTPGPGSQTTSPTCIVVKKNIVFLRFFWYLFSFWSIKISCFSFLMLRKQRFCMKLTELSNMLFHPLEEILTWQFGWKASYFCEKQYFPNIPWN